MSGAEALFFDAPGKRASLAARIARVGFFVIVFAGFIALAGYGTYRGMAVRRCMFVPCTIVSSSVEIGRDRAHLEHPYIANIDFRYFLGSKSMRSQKIEIDEKEEHFERAAEAYGLIRAYPMGASAMCFVNPADAQDAVLTRPLPRWPLIALVGCAAIAFLFLPYYWGTQFGTVHWPPTGGKKNPKSEAMAGLIFVVGGLVWLAIGFVWPLMRVAESPRWKPTPCAIISKELLVQEIHGEHHVTLYRPDILYRYEVAGAQYFSNDYNFTDYPGFWYSGGKRAILKCFGAEGTCYVNPADASDAILTRHVASSMAIVVLPLAMILGGFWPIFQYRNRPVPESPGSPVRRQSAFLDDPQELLERRYRRLKVIYVGVTTLITIAAAAVIGSDVVREYRAGALDALSVLLFVIYLIGLTGAIVAVARLPFKPLPANPTLVAGEATPSRTG